MQALICISHLRWDFVWQRPQHLLSRLAQTRRLFFVEEPVAVAAHEVQRIDQYTWHGENGTEVVVLRLMQPLAEARWIGHGDPLTDAPYRALLQEALAGHGIAPNKGVQPIVWLYTPMADAFIHTLQPSLVVYDVMDQLAAFKGAPPDLVMRDRALLQRADLVLTGGVSLYRDKLPHNPNTHLFPSGVEADHFARASRDAMPAELTTMLRPILGYFGVIDERMDLPLLATLADQHPEWSLVMIGPVVKIAFHELPQRPNLHYLGMRAYDELPAYLAHFDVALIPFAMNRATRYLSPTKTLEYLAAHKPVVSTPIPDVIELYGEVVRVGHSHANFVAQVEAALQANDAAERLPRARALLAQNSWDAIASRIASLLDQHTLPTRTQKSHSARASAEPTSPTVATPA
jgi:UDP-galactopyranose mutase